MKILITGAARGLGASLALKFGSFEEIELFLTSRNEQKLNELRQNILKLFPVAKVHIFPFDLAEVGNIPILIKKIDSITDHLDAIINNAGLLIKGSVEELDAGDISAMFAVNYLAPSMLIRHCLDFLHKAVKPHIVNISSMGGFQGSVKFPGLAHYSASKAALASLTECLATEFKGRISVNCLAIGSVQTEMLEEAFPGYQAPLTPDEMADFVMDFTLNAHKYLNGKIIPVALSNP